MLDLKYMIIGIIPQRMVLNGIKTLKSTLNIGVSIIGSITGPIGAISSATYFILNEAMQNE